MTDIAVLEDAYRPERVEGNQRQFVVISGASGSGKSTLMSLLAQRGYQTFDEPGRQIIKEQLYIGGTCVPWGDAERYIELSVSRSMHQMVSAARGERLAFFDRGVVDAVSYLEHLNRAVPKHLQNAVEKCRYHDQAFIVPPWPEIYKMDQERRHSLDEATAVFETLIGTYRRLGYDTVLLPKVAPAARADFVLAQLNLPPNA